MDEAKSQPWYQLYAAAVVELDPKQLLSAWMRLKRQFTVVCEICSTTATIMKSGTSWKTRNAPLRSCVAVLKRCGAIGNKREQGHSNVNESNPCEFVLTML